MKLNSFWLTTRWSLMTYKKGYMKAFIGLFVAFLIIMGFSTGMFFGYKGMTDFGSIVSCCSICILAKVVAGAALTALVFKNMVSKQSRIQFLMLPASNKTKFWSRVVLAIGSGIVIPAVALVCADLVQMGVSLIFADETWSITKHIVQSYTHFEYDANIHISFSEAVSGIAVMCWAVSSYVLGGTVYRKSPFILTTLSWLVFWIVIGLGGGMVMAYFSTHFQNIEVDFVWDPKTTLLWMLTAIALAFTVFNTWASYRIFKRMNAVNNGLTNL